jgi:hypothetical protein
MTITLTREEAQQLLEVFELFLEEAEDVTTLENNLVKTLRTRLAQPEPETCGYDETTGNCTQNPCCYPASPQRKEWQELSDYDVDNIVKASSGRESAVYLAEAKLKEKNS